MTPPTVPTKKKKPAGTLAALDRRAGKWRLAISRPGAAIERDTLEDAALATLGERLSKAGVGRLVRVAPACECLAKLEAAPDASGEELTSALALIGDAALPEDVPAHRRAVGMVGGRGPDARALATAWLARDAAGPKINLQGIEEVWVTEPAAVLAFATVETGSLLAWDRDTGSVFAARFAGDKPLARCIRLDSSDDAAWARGLAAAGASVGLRGAAESRPAELAQGMVSDGPLVTGGWGAVAASALAGEFGPVLGALRLASAEDASAGLVGMRRAADDGREPALLRAARWVSSPQRAGVLVAAGLAVCLLSPMAFAYVRLKIVESKLSAVGAAQDQREALLKQANLYRQMELSRWPMTKLFADVANAAPVGVTVENLSLEHEGNQGLSIKGHAEKAEDLSNLQKNLNQTGILAGVRVSSLEADSSGVSFTLQAKVVSAKSPSRITDDFGKKTLAARMYGEGATHPPSGHVEETKAAPIPDDEEMGDAPALAANPEPAAGNGGGNAGNGNTPGGRGNRGNRGNRGGGNGGNGQTPPRAGRPETATSGDTNKAAKPLEVPPALTAAELDAMDKSAAVKAWAERRAAAQRDTTSAEDKARLEEEVKKLEVKWKGGAS